jgi:hypothetical protein
MLHTKTKKMSSAVCLCVLSMLLTPVLCQADATIVLAVADTGSTASRQATEQKAALAKKAAEREAKKAAEAKTPAEIKEPNTATSPVQQEKAK